MADHEDDLLTLAEAAEALGVDVDQAAAMVEQDLLVPSDPDADPAGHRFTRAAVEAVRLAGG